MTVLVERDHIGVFGKMNAGKSSVMNLLTQQDTSIVDASPGTTADTKIALQEIHGLGPVKLFDTAGLDEQGVLGEKKRQKTFKDLKECDLILLVVDPAAEICAAEKEILAEARGLDKQILIIYNIFSSLDKNKIEIIEKDWELLRFHKKIVLCANDSSYRARLLDFILANYVPKQEKFELLPFIEKDEYYVLVIPMDVETPSGRYLRPQAMVEEYITRHWAYPAAFRLDLAAARLPSEAEVRAAVEKKRFLDFLNNFQKKPQAIITDSQAMDVLHQWCPPDIALTTFSIAMINYFSRGKLALFVAGIQALKTIRSGDKILIVEACNHSRVGEDIGTVQIPNYLAKNFPGVIVEHNFGQEFQDNKALAKYKLIIHCGGCMITAQKLQARLRDLETIGVPITNYGLVLAYRQGENALRQVLRPWGLTY